MSTISKSMGRGTKRLLRALLSFVVITMIVTTLGPIPAAIAIGVVIYLEKRNGL